MLLQLRHDRVDSRRDPGHRLVQIDLDHGDGGEEVGPDDERELGQGLDAAVEDLLGRALRPLDVLQDGHGQLHRDVVVDLEGDELSFGSAPERQRWD